MDTTQKENLTIHYPDRLKKGHSPVAAQCPILGIMEKVC